MSGMPGRSFVFRCLFVCVLGACSALAGGVVPAAAQSATASLEGTIVDQTGAVMPGVTVTVVHAATGVTRTTVTDEKGAFHLPLLPVGVYDLTTELAGFLPRKIPEINLTIGQTLTLSIQMAVSSVTETVNVSGGYSSDRDDAHAGELDDQ